MLEIFETLKSQCDWEGSSLFNDMDDLMQWARVDHDNDDGEWPDGRVVCAECVLTLDEDVVGMGRVIWDSHLEDSVPRVAHICVTPAYRTDFVIDSMEAALIEAYALEPIGGEFVRMLGGRELDLTERARAYLSGLTGHADPRMI